ncbi:MAG TPA: hypothetical protein PLP34_07290 [Chitinophagaceae bacterium]|nr:hypothetical protein [Chitinophagaceae bacterium]
MKNISVLVVLIVLFVNGSRAQTRSDVFNSSVPVTWLGVDFSEMRFIGPASGWGSESTKSASEMRDTYFHVWNDMIHRESNLFKLPDAISRKEISWAEEVCRKVNEKTNKKGIFSESSSDYQSLTEQDVEKMVKHYETKNLSGVGFVLIAEGMNKNIEEGSFWATFIDLKTKKVLFSKRVVGQAAGFGFRNYWLGSIKNVFKKMKKEFGKWE